MGHTTQCRCHLFATHQRLVPKVGIEPTTSGLWGQRSNQLSYSGICAFRRSTDKILLISFYGITVFWTTTSSLNPKSVHGSENLLAAICLLDSPCRLNIFLVCPEDIHDYLFNDSVYNRSVPKALLNSLHPN